MVNSWLSSACHVQISSSFFQSGIEQLDTLHKKSTPNKAIATQSLPQSCPDSDRAKDLHRPLVDGILVRNGMNLAFSLQIQNAASPPNAACCITISARWVNPQFDPKRVNVEIASLQIYIEVFQERKRNMVAAVSFASLAFPHHPRPRRDFAS